MKILENESLMAFLKETIQTIVTALILTFFIYYFIATPNQVQGLSMYPNVEPKELILTNRVKHHLGTTSIGEKFDWDYKRGQIIIFEQPGKDAFIKRVIGVPGDEVMVEDGKLYIDDNLITEEYIHEDVPTYGGTFLEEGKSVNIPDEHYIVFGDNRTNSLDSRQHDVGFVDRSHIIGPAEVRLLPLSRAGIIPIGETEISESE